MIFYRHYCSALEIQPALLFSTLKSIFFVAFLLPLCSIISSLSLPYHPHLSHPRLHLLPSFHHHPHLSFLMLLSPSPSPLLSHHHLHLSMQILLPALLLHGSYDFFLFASTYLSMILEKDGLALDIGALVTSVTLTVCGSIYAYRGFKKVNLYFCYLFTYL